VESLITNIDTELEEAILPARVSYSSFVSIEIGGTKVQSTGGIFSITS